MKHVLSIHSAVSLGFVGNTVVAPVLTTLGHHPVLINTITLAAHPGYGVSAGDIAGTEGLADMFEAFGQLAAWQEIDAVLTGYMGRIEQVEIIAAAIGRWTSQYPDRPYIFDPVMGDGDRLYIDDALARAMARELTPLANIITPNQFELGYLAGMAVTDRQSAIAASDTLLARHARLHAVIATGVKNNSDNAQDCGDLVVRRAQQPLWLAAHKGARNVSGGGDLMTALITGYLMSGMDLATAAIRASADTQALLATCDDSRELRLLENLDRLAGTAASD